MMFNKKIVTATMVTLIGFSGTALAITRTECKVDDSVIEKDIEYKISTDRTLSTKEIDVISKNCVVTLTGNVNTSGEASRAIEIVTSTTGVIDVNTDNLVVNDKHPFADSYITAKVKGAFVREKVFGNDPISVTGIHVETKNGVVYLTGNATPRQAQHAEELARKVDGVKRVESKINQKT